MVGMDEALVADWFVVNIGGKNGEAESDRGLFRRTKGLGVAG